jgi:hypothetical protein
MTILANTSRHHDRAADKHVRRNVEPLLRCANGRVRNAAKRELIAQNVAHLCRTMEAQTFRHLESVVLSQLYNQWSCHSFPWSNSAHVGLIA